jgi:hypothetical protein
MIARAGSGILSDITANKLSRDCAVMFQDAQRQLRRVDNSRDIAQHTAGVDGEVVSARDED